MCLAAIALDTADYRAFPAPQRFNWTALEKNGRTTYEELKLGKEPATAAQGRSPFGEPYHVQRP